MEPCIEARSHHAIPKSQNMASRRGKSIGAPTRNPNREIERSYCGTRREEEIERGTYGAGASEEARGDRAWWRRTAPSTGVRRPGTNPNRGGVVVGRRGLCETRGVRGPSRAGFLQL